MKILYPVPRTLPEGDGLRLALDITRNHGGRIRAFCVVDEPGIIASEAGAPPGAIHIAEHAALGIVDRETTLAAETVASIERTCRAEGVEVEGEVTTGSPHALITTSAADCDLLITATDARFSWGGHDKPAGIALSLMKERTVPALLAVSPFRPVRTVVVGCGGAERTLRAVGAMARLGLWKSSGVRIILLAITDSPERGEAMLSGPRGILSDNGYTGFEELREPMPKVERFSDVCLRERADAVVLGGWGEHMWNDLFGFSITGRVLRDGRQNLFLFM